MQGIQYLHSEGIVHGDLHGVGVLILYCFKSTHSTIYKQNVLLDSEFRCQITDFGSTRHTGGTVTRSTKTLSVNFAAPELFGMCTECCHVESKAAMKITSGSIGAKKRKAMFMRLGAFIMPWVLHNVLINRVTICADVLQHCSFLWEYRPSSHATRH